MILDRATRRLAGIFSRAANIQNPQIPLTAANIESYLVQQGGESAGMPITKNTVLALPAMFNGVRMIAETVAKLPLVVYERLDESGMRPARNHPAYGLLTRAPNDNVNAFDFIRTTTANAVIHGNGYGYIVRDNGMAPRQILWLDSEKTYPIRIRTFREDGQTWEERVMYQTNVDGHEMRLEARDVLHIKSFGHDDMVGHSLLKLLSEPIGLGLAQQRYSTTFFKHDGTPRLVLTLPFQLKDPDAIERFRASWGDVHQGVDNAHKVGILEGGADVKPLNANPEQTQLNQSMERHIKDIANIVGIPASFLNSDVNTSYNSLEHQTRTFLNNLNGILCNWKHETQRKLLTEEQQRTESHLMDHDRTDLERADRKTESESDAIDLNNGIATLDEIRSRRNKPPVPNGEGDKFRIPLNIGIVGEQDESSDDEPTGVVPDDSDSVPPLESSETQAERDSSGHLGQIDAEKYRGLVEHACKECVIRVKLQAIRAARNPAKFLTFVDELVDDNLKVVSNKLRVVNPESFETIARRYLESVSDELLEASGRVTSDQLKSCVEQIMTRHEKEQPSKLADQLQGES